MWNFGYNKCGRSHHQIYNESAEKLYRFVELDIINYLMTIVKPAMYAKNTERALKDKVISDVNVDLQH
jgi:hypothetical protein